jgi:hypothetical protein
MAAATASVDGYATKEQITKLDGVAAGAKVGDVVGPASATDGHLAVFDTTTGKLLKDGGAVPAGGGDVVGPASSFAGHFLTFVDTTGKLVQDGGVVPVAVDLTPIDLNIIDLAINLETLKGSILTGVAANIFVETFQALTDITLSHGTYDAVNKKVYLS